MGHVRRAIFSLGILLTYYGIATGGATESVFSALAAQDQWLAQSNDGPAWQDYLRTSELREALAAASMDKQFLASVLGRYSSNLPGLDVGPFSRTRQALTRLANELQVPLALRWAEQLRSATLFAPTIPDAAVREARYELIDAKNELQQYLAQSDAETRDGWREFLKLDELEQYLQGGDSDWKQLDSVIVQFFNGYPGLEFPQFVKVRDALRKYSYLGKLSESSEGGESINQYVEALSDALTKYNSEPTTKHASDVAALADWLQEIGQDQGVSQQLKTAHSRSNITLRISEELLARRFSQPVSDSSPVSEMILKTHVVGTAHTQGMITTDVIPNPYAAQIDIVFNGVTTTPSRGRQKPVWIRSTSVANLTARKPLYLYPADVTSAAAVAHGYVNTTIHSITPDNRLGRRLIEKVAWKRAKEQQPLTESIAAGRARHRLARKIDQQTQELLDRARASLREQIQGPINRRGLIPSTIRTASSNTHVMVSAVQADEGQLAAKSSPPSLHWGNDVVAQIHESAVNNTAEQAIAGLTLTDERIAKMVEDLTGEVPEGLQISEDDEPWSISFDWNQPVTVEFDDQQMKLSVRGRRFTRGERVLNKVMEISGTYTMQVLPGQGVVLTRQGDIEVTFPGNKDGARLGTSDIFFKTLIERKFSDLFAPVIEGDGFMLPGRFSELGKIRLDQLSTQDGWLSLGWK